MQLATPFRHSTRGYLHLEDEVHGTLDGIGIQREATGGHGRQGTTQGNVTQPTITEDSGRAWRAASDTGRQRKMARGNDPPRKDTEVVGWQREATGRSRRHDDAPHDRRFLDRTLGFCRSDLRGWPSPPQAEAT